VNKKHDNRSETGMKLISADLAIPSSPQPSAQGSYMHARSA